MSLPLPWVEKIFEKLTLVYGRGFLNRWEGIDLAAVKADWAHELADFEHENTRMKIAFALANLPTDKPPTVLEFRKIAWSAPHVELVHIVPKHAAHESVLKALNSMSPRQAAFDGREWARSILRRCEAGDKVPPYTLLCAKQALRLA